MYIARLGALERTQPGNGDEGVMLVNGRLFQVAPRHLRGIDRQNLAWL